jgi:hypothetical protein
VLGHNLIKKNPVGNSSVGYNHGTAAGLQNSGGRDPGRHRPHSDGSWDQAEWDLAWHRHWYYHHPEWRDDGWYWWDPDVSGWVTFDPGETIPEDAYVHETYPIPAAIRIANPQETGVTLNYAINEDPYEINAGQVQELTADQTWVITFDRSGDFGEARYTLEPGRYTFAMTDDHGWELYHQSLSDNVTPSSE